jgi:hypothetical protein
MRERVLTEDTRALWRQIIQSAYLATCTGAT